MRELTEELKLAPEWASHYFIFAGDKVLFVDKQNKKASTLDMINDGCCPQSYSDWFCDDDLIEIKRKPFDITKHEWSDVYFDYVDCDDDIRLYSPHSNGDFYLGKDDAIAIAKHFGLTVEDLK